MPNNILNRGLIGTSNSDVAAFWRSSGWPPSSNGIIAPAVDLELSRSSFFRGNIFSVWQDIRRVHAGFLRVAPEERGSGKGRQMLLGLGALANKYAFSEMSVGLASQYSLDIFTGVFGMDRVILFGLESGGRDIAAILRGEPMERLNIGLGEARSQLVELEKTEKDPEDRQFGFYAVIDLDGLDMSSWALPVEYQKDSVDIDVI